MDVRLWPESWEIIKIICLVYYIQFIHKQCSAVSATKPSSIAVWHLTLHVGDSFCFMYPSHM